MKFVPVSTERIEALIQLEQAASRYPWTALMLNDSLRAKADCCEIQNDDVVIGYWLVQRVLDEAELLNFVIFKPYQAQGFGQCALRKLKQDLQSQTIKKFFLEVRESNRAAKRLYQNLGFEIIHQRANYYHTSEIGGEEKEDALIMRCNLKG